MEQVKNELNIDFSDNYFVLKQNVLSAFKEYQINLFQKIDHKWPSHSEYFDDLNLVTDENRIVILHQYFQNVIISIIKFLKNVASRNDNGYFILRELLSPFETLENEMDSYIAKENQFSHVIKYLKDCEKFKERPKMRGIRSVQQLIKNLEVEHKKIILHANQIQKLTNHFTLKHKTQNMSLKTLFLEILNLITALENWFLLESQIIFPKALTMENNLLNIY